MTLEDYILAHSDQEPPLLAKLNRDVNLRLLYPRMCSGHLQGRILTMLTAMIAPRAALELGTYAGYSALCIAEGLPRGGHLDTVEIDDEMEEFIRARLAESPYGDRVSLHIGDCAAVLPSLGRLYDMVYMDANKRTYCETYRMVLPMVRPGGFILADNTLWDGHVVETCRHSSQTQGIIDFNDLVANDPRVETAIIPLRDGLTILRKIAD